MMKIFNKIGLLFVLWGGIYLMLQGALLHPDKDVFTHGILFVLLVKIYDIDRKIGEKK